MVVMNPIKEKKAQGIVSIDMTIDIIPDIHGKVYQATVYMPKSDRRMIEHSDHLTTLLEQVSKRLRIF